MFNILILVNGELFYDKIKSYYFEPITITKFLTMTLLTNDYVIISRSATQFNEQNKIIIILLTTKDLAFNKDCYKESILITKPDLVMVY